MAASIDTAGCLPYQSAWRMQIGVRGRYITRDDRNPPPWVRGPGRAVPAPPGGAERERRASPDRWGSPSRATVRPARWSPPTWRRVTVVAGDVAPAHSYLHPPCRLVGEAPRRVDGGRHA